ncbi:hypothetical protein GCM10028796_53910 [Ramlibacter monticola]|uniref:DUF2231 domain-containing protein n=1 Tax=Ramlibacter monticola TaxID=1926872 RepID=A0A936YZC0_9BURK|nr:DUF2231 domain-containing protein [Ramlibacter monticola]MBL0391723.1 DUF2231 domain-containing protein [Ramlibacter monticola]
MRTPAQIAGHPIHPMLVPIPIGLWIFSLVCDFLAMGSSAPAAWATTSFYAMVGGIIGALAAALPGLVDLLSLRHTPIRPTALKHMGLNLTIVALYVVNVWIRRDQAAAAPGGTALLLSLVAIAMLLVSGWLGGKMVYEAGVAVHTEGLGAAAVRERSAPDRSGAWSSMPAASARQHAMASDPKRPARDPLDRPSAGPSGENPRE